MVFSIGSGALRLGCRWSRRWAELGNCWARLRLGSKEGNSELHVQAHVMQLTLANRNPLLGPPRKPTNWCLLEKF